jgi:hypothetical protein
LNGAAFAELGKHKITVCGIFPHPQFMDGMAEHIGAGVAIPALEGGIHIQETSFLERSDRKRNRARSKHLLKPLFRALEAVFRLGQSRLGLGDVRKAACTDSAKLSLRTVIRI